MKTRLLLCGILILSYAGLSQGGWLDSVVEGAGKRLGSRAVNDAGNSAYGAAKGGIRDAMKGGSDDGKRTSSQPGEKGGQQESAPVSQGGSMSIEEAEKALTKFDFVPGDKVIFFDDFSDTEVGEFPRKWTFEGPKAGANNMVDVVEFQGQHFLRSVPGAKHQAPATQYVRLDQKGDFPEKFTVEFDAVFAPIKDSPVYYCGYRVLMVPVNQRQADIFRTGGPGSLLISGQDNISANTRTKVDLNDRKVHHVAISVNGTFLKAYIDNQRVVNDPEGVKRPLKQIGMQMFTPNNFKSENLLFTNFRLAAGGKDIKSALDTDGKIVTHGILFDTGQDTLKAESLPTLKMILGLMNEDQDLKFVIEGHTDNQGNKGINQPLSERRAAAVKAWLEGKQISSSRVKAAGFGDSKPIDSNKTPEGRANNRRVEFVKF